jgi:hypothetical protein
MNADASSQMAGTLLPGPFWPASMGQGETNFRGGKERW